MIVKVHPYDASADASFRYAVRARSLHFLMYKITVPSSFHVLYSRPLTVNGLAVLYLLQ